MSAFIAVLWISAECLQPRFDEAGLFRRFVSLEDNAGDLFALEFLDKSFNLHGCGNLLRCHRSLFLALG